MNNILLTILIILAFQQAFPYEIINDYNVDISIEKDHINVNEKISIVVKGYKIRLGIIRDLPRSYSFNGETISTPITVNFVKRNGVSENFWTEKNGNYLEIYTGAEYESSTGLLSHGLHTYEINWSSPNHIKSYKDFDELFLNVTGFNWDFEIKNVTVNVNLPENAKIIQVAGYRGKKGSTDKTNVSIRNNIATFYTTDLDYEEGVSVAVGFTKGYVTNPVKQSKIYEMLDKILDIFPFLTVNSVVLIILILISFIFYYICWRKYGKDNLNPVITPKCELPSYISPAKAAVVWHSGRYNVHNSFSAALVHLTYQGFITLKIKQFFKNNVNKLPAHIEEQKIFNTLFKSNQSIDMSKPDVKLSSAFDQYSSYLKELKNKYIIRHKKVSVIGIILNIAVLILLPLGRDAIGSIAIMTVLTAVYTPFVFIVIMMLTAKVVATFIFGFFIGIFILVHMSFFILAISQSFNRADEFVVFILLYAVLVILHFIFYRLMDKLIPEAAEIKQELKGLHMFMKTTDENRYKLITPEIFEKNLAFAIIFGLEKKWLKKLEEMFPDYVLEWQDQKILTTSNLRSFNGSVNRSARTTSSSSSSGFSRSGSSGRSSSGGRGSSGGGGGRGR